MFRAWHSRVTDLRSESGQFESGYLLLIGGPPIELADIRKTADSRAENATIEDVLPYMAPMAAAILSTEAGRHSSQPTA